MALALVLAGVLVIPTVVVECILMMVVECSERHLGATGAIDAGLARHLSNSFEQVVCVARWRSAGSRLPTRHRPNPGWPWPRHATAELGSQQASSCDALPAMHRHQPPQPLSRCPRWRWALAERQAPGLLVPLG